MSEQNDPSLWREGFMKLSPSNPPCPGFRADEWREIHPTAKAFLEARASEAANLGWRGVDLFAVHDKVGGANVSACGALMLGNATESAGEITPEFIRFGRLRYFRRPMQSAVLVWRFAA